MAKSFSLIVSAPDAEPVHYRLSGDEVNLGRSEGNGIAVSVKAVSSRHCQFRKIESGGYRIVDLDSTNGTRVNGQRIMNAAGAVLKSGDRLLFGETVEAQFFEAIDAAASGKKTRAPSESESPSAWIPLPVWVDASEESLGDEEINPVAAAVARQQGSSPSRG